MSEIKTNKISSLDSSNSDITIDPDGTGKVYVPSQLDVEAATGDATLRVHAAEADSSSEPILVLESSNDFAESVVEFKDSSGVGGRIAYNHGDNALRFQTNGLSERLRITSGGSVFMGKTSSGSSNSGFEYEGGNALLMTRNNARPFVLNRGGNDGILIDLRQADNTEGTISVSGTTVSYNGGHLSRWSQATDGSRITGLVKGTVMTNLDQMAVWHHEAQPATYYEEGDELPEGVSVGDEKTPAVDAYDEDNEQLNCMAVSSVEGDANVAGVFVNFDDDDTDFTADMNIAMTGDMVIRIAQGTTVARGDLLMSAGDGTAKPQGDDIVRSKTIAKVTSTTVSHTYDDGSYLVPCVLMAC